MKTRLIAFTKKQMLPISAHLVHVNLITYSVRKGHSLFGELF